VAQLLAEQTGAPIISADSMNIYRGMDIGTAKPTAEERGAVNYFGIDLADPTEPFSVGDWLAAVRPVWGQSSHSSSGGVSPIISSFRNDEIIGLTPQGPPIVAGGTGLYVKCLLAGLDEQPAADEALRVRAEKMSLAELQAEAQNASPEAYAALADNENPRRLVRLLEKAFSPHLRKCGEFPTLGKQKGAGSACWKKELPTVVGLHVEREILLKRIAARVDEMYAGGLIDEARGLMDLELSATAEKAIGYAEAFAVLKNEMTEAQAKERTIIRTRQLAKRQMTWFRTQLNVEWVDTQKFQGLELLASEVSKVWKKVPVSL